MVLLIRHAERFPVTDRPNHSAVMLTDQGKRDARALGASVGRRFRSTTVWHSPIPRCRETAESLVVGATESGGRAQLGGPLGWLGGDLIGGDPIWVNEQIAVNGPEAFLRLWFDGEYSRQQIAPLQEAAALQMGQVLRQLQNSRSSVVADITHDWNLMLLREHYLRLRHEDVGVPAYLDSVAVLRRGGLTTVWSLGSATQLSDGRDAPSDTSPIRSA